MILDDADRLDRLVGRLLELARADAGSAVESVVYPSLVATAADRVRGSGVVVEYRADRSIVSAQRAALASALDNLLANAAAHATTGTDVRVRVTDEPDGALRTEVHNHGAPIAPDRVARLWDRFYTTRPGGTGLGLSIVKTAVEAHGGTVGVTSDADDGTRFWFTLP